MYSVDGIALDNEMLGWTFLGSSRPLSGHTAQRTSLRVPGMPGVLAGVEDVLTTLDPVPLVLTVQTPRRNHAVLTSLLLEGSVLTRTGTPGRQAAIECLSVSPEGYGPAEEIIDVTAAVRIPGVFWRDTDLTTEGVDLTASSVTFDRWAMDGLVTDALIRVRGTTGLRITSRWGHVEYTPAIPAGSFFRYDCRTGRSYVTTSDTWSGGSEVSGVVDDDGPGEKFAIFPTRLNPFASTGRLSIATTARASGARLEVRGRAAYLAGL